MSVKKVWAPWRLEYIKTKRDPEDNVDNEDSCPFCQLSREEASEENLVLFKNSDFFVVMNKFPYNPAHLLVIPTSHVENPSQVNKQMWSETAKGLQLCLSLLAEYSETAPHGYNLGMNVGRAAGAGIPEHLHWHILPRWEGDTNFMPLLAETKAIPTHNRTVYRQLKKVFSNFASRLAQM